MLQIRERQHETFRQVALERFITEMVLHAQDFSPKLCAVLGEAQVREAVRQAVGRGEGYGFSNRGPLRLYVEMTFLYGSAFDTDPQYPWAREILRRTDGQTERATALYEGVLAYQKEVSGFEGMNTRRTLAGLQALVRQPTVSTAASYPGEVRRELARIAPERMARLDDRALAHLLEASGAEARGHRFPPGQGEALLTVLKFVFGHGCTDDPLYPWISRTLQDASIPSPEARMDRLQQNAASWLDHVLADAVEPLPT